MKVVLSGAGGDELFGGYPWRYYRGARRARRDDYCARYYDFWQRLVPDDGQAALFTADVRARDRATARTFDVFRARLRRLRRGRSRRRGLVNASLYFELKTFLHGLLVVEDKLSMAHCLETRVPFLDNDLVDFALRLPARLQARATSTARRASTRTSPASGSASRPRRATARRCCARRWPASSRPRSTGRRKQGFSAPDASWFRGESIDYINRLLRDPRARDLRVPVSRDYVARRPRRAHCRARSNHRLLIWSLLSFEWWCRCFLDGSASNPAPADSLELAAR